MIDCMFILSLMLSVIEMFFLLRLITLKQWKRKIRLLMNKLEILIEKLLIMLLKEFPLLQNTFLNILIRKHIETKNRIPR